jgi:hypothetical protein
MQSLFLDLLPDLICRSPEANEVVRFSGFALSRFDTWAPLFQVGRAASQSMDAWAHFEKKIFIELN